MPEICRFYGIVIRMYFDDHPPPHSHAVYGDDEAVAGIESIAYCMATCRDERRGSYSNGPPCTERISGKRGAGRAAWRCRGNPPLD